MVTERPSWDFPRGPSGIRVLLDVAAARGIPARACLAGCGLQPADLEDPGAVVEAAQELAVVRNVVRLSGDEPGWGSDAGARITLGMLGIWGYAMVLSPTVRDVLRVAMRHGPGKLSWVFLQPRLETGGGEVRLVYDDGDVPADVRSFLVERDVACTAKLVPAIVGEIPGLRIETALDPARRRALAAAVPHASVRAAAGPSALVFGARVLDRPLATADPQALRECERECEALVARRAARSGVAARVQSLLLRRLPDAPTLADVAAERHVDPRTLRRHLDAEGTSFRALAAEVREALAVELLTTTSLAVEEVAHRVGYADAATFTRAFKRWTGTTPGAVARGAAPAGPARAGARAASLSGNARGTGG